MAWRRGIAGIEPFATHAQDKQSDAPLGQIDPPLPSPVPRGSSLATVEG